VRGRSLPALVALIVSVGVAAVLAGAGTGKSWASGQGVYRSGQCSRPVKPYDFAAWACTTVTVTPNQVKSGGTTTLAFSFKAKTTLRYVQVCISRMIGPETTKNCAWQHRYANIAKGSTVKHVLTLAAPTVSESGGYGSWTYVWFYKPPKYATKGEGYWNVHAFACVVADGDTNSVCQGGK
jgi:hypothetical protein